MQSSEKWVRCPKCGRKFFKLLPNAGMNLNLETKCGSCGAVISVMIDGDIIKEEEVRND